MKNGKLPKPILAAVVIAVLAALGSPALGQEWTPDKDQVVE